MRASCTHDFEQDTNKGTALKRQCWSVWKCFVCLSDAHSFDGLFSTEPYWFSMIEISQQEPVSSLLSDRDLLRRFVQDADEAAFAEIVRRHQGLVMGVCRRVIGNDADVDDAFQATFIALARRPRQIRKAKSLSSWLYSVAWRTSICLIKQRRKHPVESLPENPKSKDADTLERIASAQDCMVLDEELQTLPEKYREVLVMTYFAGHTSQEIADQLSVSKGTVDGRIRDARNALRVRLARRGVAIGVLTVAAAMSTGTAAAASPALLNSTIQLGAESLSGSLPGTTDLSHLEPLIQVESTMIASKLIVSAVLCATAIAGIASMKGEFPVGGFPANEVDETNLDTVQESKLPIDQDDAPAGIVVAGVAEEVPAGKAEIAEVLVTPLAPAGARKDVSMAEGSFVVIEHPSRIMQAIEFDSSILQVKPVVGNSRQLTLSGTKNGHTRIRVVDESGSTTFYEVTVDQDGAAAGSVPLAGVENGKPRRAFQPYASDARPVEKWMYEMLEQPVPLLDYQAETPLSELLKQIANYYSTQHGGKGGVGGSPFRMVIFPDKAELSMESIESLEDVLVSGILVEGVELQNALDLIFEQTTDPELAYEIKDEVLMVTTKSKAESDASLTTRVYDVRNLIGLDYADTGFSGASRVPMGRGGGFFSMQVFGAPAAVSGGAVPVQPANGGQDEKPVKIEPSLTTMVMEMTSPPCKWFDLDGEGGAIRLVGESLVVRQTAAGHREVVRLLNLLTESVLKNNQ